MKITVFCGSAQGNHRGFIEAAEDLGRELAGRGIDLVYGGSSGGLMGAIADSVLAAGGRVHGVMPHHLADHAHAALTWLDLVDTMYQRKSRMVELADAFIAIPGGTGTLEELFEAWNHAILGIHTKPVAILNTGGYYDKLIAFLDDLVRTEFGTAAGRRLLHVGTSPTELVATLAEVAAGSHDAVRIAAGGTTTLHGSP
jgi:uncharacterized protein (TIGR00730 family)